MPPIPAQGIKAAILPGVFSGLLLALEHHGTKSFAEVVAPAIEYADGFPLGEEFVGFIRNDQRVARALAGIDAQFFLPGGESAKRGEIFREPTLANTLRELAQVEKKARGNRAKKIRAVHDYFYKGDLRKKIAAFSEANGGLHPVRRSRGSSTPRPIRRAAYTYRGYEIFKPGFWTQGPVMLQALAILEGFDLRAMGHNSPEYLHTVVEAVKLAFADRDRHYGDPKFSQDPGRDPALESMRQSGAS